jgi:hypothetical protein
MTGIQHSRVISSKDWWRAEYVSWELSSESVSLVNPVDLVPGGFWQVYGGAGLGLSAGWRELE